MGPQLVSLLAGHSPDATIMRYFPVYIAALLINVFGALMFFLLDIPKPAPTQEQTAPTRSTAEILRQPQILVAIIVGAVSYSLMNLVMTSTPLAVVGCGFGVPDASNVVTAHVIAMFLPSFFTGHLIARFGVEKIMATGLLILAAAGLVALNGVTLTNFFGALILLGIGWNFGFIGATTLLTMSHRPEERGRSVHI